MLSAYIRDFLVKPAKKVTAILKEKAVKFNIDSSIVEKALTWAVALTVYFTGLFIPFVIVYIICLKDGIFEEQEAELPITRQNEISGEFEAEHQHVPTYADESCDVVDGPNDSESENNANSHRSLQPELVNINFIRCIVMNTVEQII